MPDVDEARAAALARDLGVSAVLARILLARGIDEPAAARRFLKPDWQDLHDPRGMRDMDRAVERLRRALRTGERILVFGDYDVDGLSATTLLKRLFSVMDHAVSCVVPDRIGEGYGLTPAAAGRIVGSRRVDLVVTVDCGTSDHAGVARLGRHGIDVIVTDHHVAPAELPPAYALVNPMRRDCPYPFKRLAGVGVAFKLAWAIGESFSPRRRLAPEFRKFLQEAAALVALGTVCDVVPLVGENRVLVSYGLRSLADSPSPGLRALLDVVGLSGKELDPPHLGFKVGPRINAAGRMGAPEEALELLTATSYPEALDRAARLNALNTRRQNLERAVYKQVVRAVDEGSIAPAHGVVMARQGWSPGITGIVASRLVDGHGTPAVLIALTETVGRGSGRSIPGFNLLDLLQEFADSLTTYGGHPGAVGFTLELDEVEGFVAGFGQRLKETLATFHSPPRLRLDGRVGLGELSPRLVRELERLRPFGERNPPPLFLAEGVKICGRPRPLGRKPHRLRFLVRQAGLAGPVPAVAPSAGLSPEAFKARSPCDLAYVPHLVFQGGRGVLELDVKAVAPAAARLDERASGGPTPDGSGSGTA